MEVQLHSSYEAWVMTLEPLTEVGVARYYEEKVKLEKSIKFVLERIAESGSTPQRESTMHDKQKRIHEIELHLKHRGA